MIETTMCCLNRCTGHQVFDTKYPIKSNNDIVKRGTLFKNRLNSPTMQMKDKLRK